MIPLKSIWQFLTCYCLSKTGITFRVKLTMSLQVFAKHSLDKIKQIITELNRLWNIKPTPHGTIGLQQSLRDQLQVRLAHLLRVSKPDATFLQDKVLQIVWGWDEHQEMITYCSVLLIHPPFCTLHPARLIFEDAISLDYKPPPPKKKDFTQVLCMQLGHFQSSYLHRNTVTSTQNS